MKLEELRKLAHLSRIQVSDEELSDLQEDLERIIRYVSDLKALPDVQLEIVDTSLSRNVMREDSSPHETGLHTKALLEQAPQREGAYVKVKKILP